MAEKTIAGEPRTALILPKGQPSWTNEPRVGDWEAELVIGQGHKGAIVTLSERRSRRYLALAIVCKTGDLTTQAITTLSATFKNWTHSITYVNGQEFSGHAAIAKALDCQGFFARPTIVGNGD